MPVSPDLGERLAHTVIGHYLEAERVLLARIARHLAAGIDSPHWAEQKLLTIQALRRQAQAVVGQLRREATGTIGEAITTAYNRGGAAAAAELAGLFGRPPGQFAGPPRVSGAAAIEALAAETVGLVTGTHPRILRWADDVYRQVIADTAGSVLLGSSTRRQAAQTALNRLTARGVVGFVDRAGRGWDLAAYVEMAMRSATGRAAVQAHTDRLAGHGLDLVIVSNAPQECALCRPLEGKVLSLSGATAGVIDGSGGARVWGSMARARGAGLFHPGCRHSVSVYLPGVTTVPRQTADPAGDLARQRLRYLERQVRSWKRREAVALDDGAAAAARARVRAYQARIRSHVSSTSAKRQPARERIGVAR